MYWFLNIFIIYIYILYIHTYYRVTLDRQDGFFVTFWGLVILTHGDVLQHVPLTKPYQTAIAGWDDTIVNLLLGHHFHHGSLRFLYSKFLCALRAPRISRRSVHGCRFSAPGTAVAFGRAHLATAAEDGGIEWWDGTVHLPQGSVEVLAVVEGQLEVLGKEWTNNMASGFDGTFFMRICDITVIYLYHLVSFSHAEMWYALIEMFLFQPQSWDGSLQVIPETYQDMISPQPHFMASFLGEDSLFRCPLASIYSSLRALNDRVHMVNILYVYYILYTIYNLRRSLEFCLWVPSGYA